MAPYRWWLSLSLLLLCSCQPTPPQALGTLERDRITLTATANEIITALPIKEGQQLNQGDVLVVLSDARQQAMVARAQAEYAKAEAFLLKLTNGERPEDIASANANVQRAQSAYSEAAKNFKRIDQLVADKVISVADRDTAIARRDELAADLSAATENLNKLIKGVRKEDIVQASAALNVAKAELQLQQQILQDLVITATRAGKLDSLPYNLGERVPQNATVAVILADRAPYARVYVPETFRVQLPVGAQRKVHIDGKAQPLTGKLRWISTEPAFTPYYALNENDRSRLMYLAEFDIVDSNADLPTGVPVSVELQP